MQTHTTRLTGTSQLAACGRIVLITLAICSLAYPLLILAIGQAVTPFTANGSLLRGNDGRIVGSAALAQGFARPEYFWPRPSAVDYNASAAGGSNLSPANPALRARAEDLLGRLGREAGSAVPADLVTASGSGLDPHITLAAARWQTRRVATARGLPAEDVAALIEKHARRSEAFFAPEPLVNVLLLNIALDRGTP
ncbi:MAG: potassium-transporting ATPase subunit KdpC [Desulfobacterales bacterium]|nr:potassium-transporting ATPase subunit KdpC [Desulfobacterales bacterium]